jgi:hypothetical protein
MKINLTKLGQTLIELIDEAKEEAAHGDRREEYSVCLGHLEIEGVHYQAQIKITTDEREFLDYLLCPVIDQ